jgi:regulator of protease activity HflC (stomatin/prohibitin superfamily)
MKQRALLIAACGLSLAACGQVHPGHVGIKVNQFGSNAGVSNDVLGVGTYFTPFGTHIEEYPVYTNTYTYTASTTEGSQNNEEFNFQDQSGVNISADVGVSYSVNPQKASVLFQKYRVDAAGIIAGPLRNEIRNELIDVASQMNVQDIYGPKKQALLESVQAHVAAFFAPYGLNVEKLFWANNIRLPQNIQDQITARIANENAALAAQAKVATVQAEAQQRIAQAEGEAKAIQVQAEAIRTNPEIIQLRAIEKWDGHLPTYASNGPLPFIGNPAR